MSGLRHLITKPIHISRSPSPCAVGNTTQITGSRFILKFEVRMFSLFFVACPLQAAPPQHSGSEAVAAEELTSRCANQAKLLSCGVVEMLLQLALEDGGVGDGGVRSQVSRSCCQQTKHTRTTKVEVLVCATMRVEWRQGRAGFWGAGGEFPEPQASSFQLVISPAESCNRQSKFPGASWFLVVADVIGRPIRSPLHVYCTWMSVKTETCIIL